MMLDEYIELIEGAPIAYLKDISAIAVSDLHLGYEGVMAKRGALIPQVNLKKTIEMLGAAIEAKKPKSIIVNGDIKNEFSGVDEAEFNELYELINFTKEKGVELVLIKGNHDNFVERYKEPFKLKVYRQQMETGRYLFFHGEELPAAIGKNARILFMGHEHPAIGVYNAAGRQEKLRCFLKGSYRGRDLIVLPAMNYFASGTAVNLEPKRNLLSPIFRKVDIDGMTAIAIGYGSTMDFGKVRDLRKIAKAGYR